MKLYMKFTLFDLFFFFLYLVDIYGLTFIYQNLIYLFSFIKYDFFFYQKHKIHENFTFTFYLKFES